jgi:hypothetical protein
MLVAALAEGQPEDLKEFGVRAKLPGFQRYAPTPIPAIRSLAI